MLQKKNFSFNVQKFQNLFLFVVCFFFYLATPLLATPEKIERMFLCPVCETKFKGYALIKSSVPQKKTFGGQDSDFLSHSLGEQPILIEPITCTNCYFSNDLEGFSESYSLATKEKIKKEIKVPAMLIGSPKKTVSQQIPAFLRYELRAQTYKILGNRPVIIAHQYLLASWAIRLQASPMQIFSKKIKREISAKIKEDWNQLKAQKNRAQYELKLGWKYKRLAKNTKSPHFRIYALTAIVLLRRHGENEAVEELLLLLEPVLEKEVFAELKPFLANNIKQERLYQKQALQLFETVLQEEKAAKEVNILYLCAELSRRLKEWKVAYRYYQRALKENRSLSLHDTIQKQLKLLPLKQD